MTLRVRIRRWWRRWFTFDPTSATDQDTLDENRRQQDVRKLLGKERKE